eukprot:CAMPEP_0195060172 /NCGR_PEP_ID=MMETSP0448-20130528/7495_1 /TAXON_ID=66468 /ORGANISM="Heterocapsa triquestra, Strain CCMP 448" /LENGTH=156 /DNA_ID=CAMNT_0040090543 /DNA_START=99 /DNA_END=567 /DNA_ORIENTATION=-
MHKAQGARRPATSSTSVHTWGIRAASGGQSDAHWPGPVAPSNLAGSSHAIDLATLPTYPLDYNCRFNTRKCDGQKLPAGAGSTEHIFAKAPSVNDLQPRGHELMCVALEVDNKVAQGHERGRSLQQQSLYREVQGKTTWERALTLASMPTHGCRST